MKIKPILKVALIIISLILTGCNTQITNDNSNEYVVKENIQLKDEENLYLDTDVSDINIKEGTGDSLEIDIKKVMNPKYANNSIDISDYLKYDQSSNGKDLSIDFHEIKKDSNINYIDSHINLTLPKQVKVLDIRTQMGNIDIDYNTKEILAETQMGNIRANFETIENDNYYNFHSDMGDIDISLPKNSKINIKDKKLKYSDDMLSSLKLENVKESDKGATFDLKLDGMQEIILKGVN